MTWNFSNVTGQNKSSDFIKENGGNVYVYKIPDRGALSSSRLKTSLETLSNNISSQWNIWQSYLKPMLNSLPAGVRDTRWDLNSKVDCLLYGIQGATLLVNNDANATSSNGRYWDSTKSRPKSIAESFEDLWDKIAYIESTGVSTSTGGATGTDLSYIGSFIGMTNPNSNELPSYSSTVYISQNVSLESAISQLDSALSSYVPTVGPVITLDETTTPASGANTGRIYTKDVSALTEFFYLDSAGNEIQLTSGGSINVSIPTISLQDAYEGGSIITLSDTYSGVHIAGANLTSGDVFSIHAGSSENNVLEIDFNGNINLFSGGDLSISDSRYTGTNGPTGSIPLTDTSNVDFDFATNSMMHSFNQLYALANEMPEPLIIPTTDQELIDALESTAPCTIILRAQDYTLTSETIMGAAKVIVGTGFTGNTDDGTKSSRIVCDGGYIRSATDENIWIKNVSFYNVDSDYCIYIRQNTAIDNNTKSYIDNCIFKTAGAAGWYIYVFDGHGVTVSDCIFNTNYNGVKNIYIYTYSGENIIKNNRFIWDGTSLQSSSITLNSSENTHIINNIFKVEYNSSFDTNAALIDCDASKCTISGNFFHAYYVKYLSYLIYSSGAPANVTFSNNTVKWKSYYDDTSVGGVIHGRFSSALIANNNIETSIGCNTTGKPLVLGGNSVAVINLGLGCDQAVIIGNVIKSYEPNPNGYKCGIIVHHRMLDLVVKDNSFFQLGGNDDTEVQYGIFFYRDAYGVKDKDYYPACRTVIDGNVFSVQEGKEEKVQLVGFSESTASYWEEIIFKNNTMPYQKIRTIPWDDISERFISDIKRSITVESDYQIKNYDSRINADASSEGIDVYLYSDSAYLRDRHSTTIRKVDSSVNLVNVLSGGFKQTYNLDTSYVYKSGSSGFEHERYRNGIVFNGDFYYLSTDGDLIKWNEATKTLSSIYSTTSGTLIRTLSKYTEPSGGVDQELYFITYGTVKSLTSWDGTSLTDHGNNGGLTFNNILFNNSDETVYVITDETNDRVLSYDPNTTIWTDLSIGTTGRLGDMIIYNGNLFVAKRDSDYEILEWDGTSWTTYDLSTLVSGGTEPDFSIQFFVDSLENKLFVADYDGIFSYDGTTWTHEINTIADMQFSSSYFKYDTTNGNDFYCLSNIRLESNPPDYLPQSVSLLCINKDLKVPNVVSQLLVPNYDGNYTNIGMFKYDENKYYVLVYDRFYILERTEINGDYSAVLSAEGECADLRFDGQDWWGTTG